MIKLINRMTGTAMWVADSRLEEYLAKGHTLSPMPDNVKPEKATPAEMAAQKKKATRKR